MKKKRKIDYILNQDDYSRLIFRFYPRQSSCHSFDEKPPTKPEEIYKVYYNYAIIKQYKFGTKDQWTSKVMFHSHCDECSIIDGIGRMCLMLADGYETYEREDGDRIPLLNETFRAFGMGVDWMISKHVCTEYGYEEDDEDIITTYYTFMLFDSRDKGFKFTLEDKDMKAFGEYLLRCCEYMLAHGDPI